MKICAVQISSAKGDLSANIAKHLFIINQIAPSRADIIFFPELSLTGYEPTLAKSLAIACDLHELSKFQELSNKLNITLLLGAPIRTSKGVLIGMPIFKPNEKCSFYAKEILHADEFPYFIQGAQFPIIEIKNFKIAPAICFESLQHVHSKRAHSLGAQTYLASVAKPSRSLPSAHAIYSQIAKTNNFPVIMSNSVGACDNFIATGSSAVWDSQGTLVGQLDEAREGFIVYDTNKLKYISLYF